MFNNKLTITQYGEDLHLYVAEDELFIYLNASKVDLCQRLVSIYLMDNLALDIDTITTYLLSIHLLAETKISHRLHQIHT